MSQSSYNLSNRIYFTVDYNGCTARIGTLYGSGGGQKKLVEFTHEELIKLIKICKEHIDIDDLLFEGE